MTTPRAQSHARALTLRFLRGERHADVAAVDQNFTRLNVVKSLNEQYYGALAAAAGPHKRYALLRLDDKIEIIQNEGFRPRGIREAHVLELNSTLKRRRAVSMKSIPAVPGDGNAVGI